MPDQYTIGSRKLKRPYWKTSCREYNTYMMMKRRCYKPNSDKYKYYGGRGIIVCARWLESFDNFLADMGRKPSPSHSIDRYPNKDGNYEPDNCRWATPTEQVSNTRRNHMIEIAGRTQTATAWAREFGYSVKTIHERIRTGWSPLEAVMTPPAKDNGGWSTRRKRIC